jgi:hypothetical protein
VHSPDSSKKAARQGQREVAERYRCLLAEQAEQVVAVLQL